MKVLHWLKETLLWSDENDERMKKLLKRYWPKIVKNILVIAICILFVICLVSETKQNIDRMDRETEEFLEQWK